MKIIHNEQSGFTILELLVIIVIIGILAAVTVVSYTGINQKATAASLQTDSENSSKKLKMYYVEYGSYPTSMNLSTGCPDAPVPDSNYCFKLSSGNTFEYTSDGVTFNLIIKTISGSQQYFVTDNSSPSIAGVPVLTSPTSTSITSSGATLGANLTSTGGHDVTALGTCWGTSANPTTNCSSQSLGSIPLTVPSSSITTLSSFHTHLIISPDGKSAYAPSGSTDSISMFSRDENTGNLTPLSPATIATGDNPQFLAISPDGTSVYSGNWHSNNVSMYSRNTITGLLTALSPATIAAGSNTGRIAVSPDGTSVYAVSINVGAVYMYSRNTSTGLLTALSPATISSEKAKDVIVSPNGDFVYVVNGYSINTISMYSRNTSTGLLTALSPATISGGNSPYQIVISADGKSVYSTGYYGVLQRNASTTTGQLTAMSPGSISADVYEPRGIAVSSDGTSVYVVDKATSLSMYSRDISTGLLTKLSPATISTDALWPYYVTISPDDKYIYVTVNGSTTSIYYIKKYKRTTSFSPNVFTQARTGMSSGTLIYYRGYATNSVGTGYSSDGTFTTL